jgi:hypothetical protein
LSNTQAVNAPMNEVVVKTKEQAPLDELMLAMDVVDTLRHRELVLERELTADDRDQRLLERLREIYAAQGIPVTDEVLEQGVRALREERFVYAGPEAGVGRTLATLYVTRDRWGKWVGGLALLAAAALLGYQLLVRGPELRAMNELPADLQGAYQGIVVTTDDERALGDASALLADGQAAVERRDLDEAREAVGQLRELSDRLQQQYELRVVSRPGEQSGVWRVPDENPGARNYYLIVEAVAPDGSAVPVPIRNEEDGRTRQVRTFGLRVDESTFERVAADKRDDGIIQQGVVGTKRRGELEPEYSVATTGATITDW